MARMAVKKKKDNKEKGSAVSVHFLSSLPKRKKNKLIHFISLLFVIFVEYHYQTICKAKFKTTNGVCNHIWRGILFLLGSQFVIS